MQDIRAGQCPGSHSLSTSLHWEPTGGTGSQAPPNRRAGISALQDPQEVLKPKKHFCGLNRGHISIHTGEADAQRDEAGPGSHSWFQPWLRHLHTHYFSVSSCRIKG